MKNKLKQKWINTIRSHGKWLADKIEFSLQKMYQTFFGNTYCAPISISPALLTMTFFPAYIMCEAEYLRERGGGREYGATKGPK